MKFKFALAILVLSLTLFTSCSEAHKYDGVYLGEGSIVDVVIELDGNKMYHTTSITPEIELECNQELSKINYTDVKGVKHHLKVISLDTLLMEGAFNQKMYFIKQDLTKEEPNPISHEEFMANQYVGTWEYYETDPNSTDRSMHGRRIQITKTSKEDVLFAELYTGHDLNCEIELDSTLKGVEANLSFSFNPETNRLNFHFPNGDIVKLSRIE